MHCVCLSRRRTVTATCTVLAALNATPAVQEAALFRSDGHSETLAALAALGINPKTSVPTVQSHMDKCRNESLGVHESFTGKQPFKIPSRDVQGLKVIAFLGIPRWTLRAAGVVERSAEGWMLL